MQGIVDLHSRLTSLIEREWRGAFVFRSDDEPAMTQLAEAGGPTVCETMIEGEPRRLTVTVKHVSPSGLAFFEGSELH